MHVCSHCDIWHTVGAQQVAGIITGHLVLFWALTHPMHPCNGSLTAMYWNHLVFITLSQAQPLSDHRPLRSVLFNFASLSANTEQTSWMGPSFCSIRRKTEMWILSPICHGKMSSTESTLEDGHMLAHMHLQGAEDHFSNFASDLILEISRKGWWIRKTDEDTWH